MLSVTAMLQTSFFKFSLTPYYSSSWDETILLYESLEIIIAMKKIGKSNLSFKKTQKLKFSLFFDMITFLSSDDRPSFGFSTSIKFIDKLFLPDDICFVKNPSRK